MADKLIPADLQRMKREGRKIAAGVAYDFPMAKICERAGVDLLSVGDSVGRALLGQDNVDDFTVDEMLVFGRAVGRAAEHAVVSVDMPTATCKAGPKAVMEATRRIKAEAHADMTKVDIRTMEEQLFDDVRAVIEAGLAVYPQMGFQVGEPAHSDSAAHDHVMKWAHALEDAGASLIDLTNVSHEIYGEVSKTLRIPVIGGQTGPEADGRIYVMAALVGYRPDALDRTDGAPTAARLIYDLAEKAFANVHAGAW
ncbi:MAG: hypothetical protein EXR58_04855 [Chloroflexi bacterium]|nr:hypothetical protein [Chloroflexota bacterium]